MAFLIPDDLKSKKPISSSIRNVIEALQLGLDESVTVWYEPPYDPSGEKPHLVVLFPNRGVSILEVLETGSANVLGVYRQKIRLERDGREIEAQNPLVRAERFASSLKEKLAREPGLSGLPVRAAAALPGISRTQAIDAGLKELLPLESCLFKDEVDRARQGAGEADLLRIFARLFVSPPAVAHPDREKILRGIIQPDISIARISQAPAVTQLQIFHSPAGSDNRLNIMDRQQEAMAKSFGDGHRIIRGVAGSGKTLLLVYRVRLLSGAFPQHRYLLTCFTRSLAGQLRELLKDRHNVDVQHVDGLMSDVISQAGMKHPGYAENPDLVVEAALQALDQGCGPRYHGVFLDEAQDFGTEALRFVKGLLRENWHDLVIVADAAQNIFRRRFSWKQAGIQAQGRTRILRINYRNTMEIMQFATEFLLASGSLEAAPAPDPEDENAVITSEASQRSGRNPRLIVVDNTENEIKKAVEQVKEWLQGNNSPGSLGLLYCANTDHGIKRSDLLMGRLRREGIPVFWVSDEDDKSKRDRIAQATEPVILSTVHSAKGLEFETVVLCGLWRDDYDSEANRKLAYVGMTRATDNLCVITKAGYPLLADLRGAAGRCRIN